MIKKNRPPVLLLRSSWQSVNIGDIAHTPGLLRTLARFYPEAEVVLWPRNLGRGADELLRHYFPDLRIVQGDADAEGCPVSQEVKAAWEQADLFLHGSGPGFCAYREASAWHRMTDKPYGFFGITAERPRPEHIEAANPAQFLLTRDSTSIQHVKEAGIVGPEVAFCPDATFACDLRDDAKASAYLRETGLRPGGFVCMVPRLRYTPYHQIHGFDVNDEHRRRDAVNDTYAEQDHGKMRAAIIRIVRETGLDVLLCPEMTYQVDIMDALLYDPLPDDVKARVHVRRRYWLPDEATAVYAQARSLVSFECHSPILALRQGVPVIYLRQPTDSIKGQMWRDIGLESCILEIDEVDADAVADAAMRQIMEPEASRELVTRTLHAVDDMLQAGVETLRKALAPVNTR